MSKKFSIIVPVYGNEFNLPTTIPYIVEHLNLFSGYETELVMVCDGSPDNSYKVMKQYQKKYPEIIKIAKFTRNFGQGAAVHCGMKMATGDVLGVISADLQDPFELFVDMLAYWEEGYKFVIGTRKKRHEKGLSVLASQAMHKLTQRFINKKYPKGGFDFYLLDRSMAQDFLKADAPNGSTQLLLLWMGYEYKLIEYERKERTIGKSGYNLKKRLNAALGFFVTYSNMPIRIFSIPVIANILLALAFLIVLIIGLVQNREILILLGTILLFLNIFMAIVLSGIMALGEYIWRIQDLSRTLPRYVIDELVDDTKKE